MATIGTIVVAMDPLCDGSYNRIGKILAIVDRPNIYYGGIQQIALVRLQHNGSHYIIPHSKLREATSEEKSQDKIIQHTWSCLLYTSPSPRDGLLSRMPSSA